MPTRRYKITKDELKEAYIKYKAHVYHDTTELFQRRKLAEFETGLLSDDFLFGNNLYDKGIFNFSVELEAKFESILEWINTHHSKGHFNQFLDEIYLLFLPKKFEKLDSEVNFITNKRVANSYKIDRVTVFAEIPVELHLVTILWIMKYGYKLDAKLDSSCMGNRLLLNRSNNSVIKGSGLFKPYFTQYQKWRDNAVEEAQRKLHSGSTVAFINLDLKDYFYSARIDFEIIEKEIWGEEGYRNNSNIHDIFKELHKRYTDKLKETKYPNAELENQIGDKCILPIGIASSYILGNFYLHDFDIRIKKQFPQVCYRRYVDDILVVIENPDFNFHNTEECNSVKFSFEKYLKEVKFENEAIGFKYKDISKTEKFILETFYPLIRLVDYPDYLMSFPQTEHDTKDEKRIFKITCIPGAYFQPKKTLLYYFDSKESTAVIDKLKQDLEERASEFRDFPEDSEGEESFDEQAYYLIFDGSEGKIRTLKDYKENRYGLSVFLANRIFAALRHSKKVDQVEVDKLLKLFKGLNNLEFFRLWEKIFTFFLVNDNPDGFVSFFKHTYIEIKKLNNNSAHKIQGSDITQSNVATSLFKYFDISFEMPIALNPSFIKKGSKPYKDLEIFRNTHDWEIEFLNNITVQGLDSLGITRFRKSNLIRHHYVSHPLLNYTKEARAKHLNLSNSSLPEVTKAKCDRFKFSEASITLSPRMVKFWECCIAVVNMEMLVDSDTFVDNCDDRYQNINLFKESEDDKKFILDKAFSLYERINRAHFPTDCPTKNDFYRRAYKTILGTNGERKVELHELQINKDLKFKENPKISIANTQVLIKNIEASLKGKPNLSNQRYKVFSKLLKESRIAGADLFVLPEFSVPYEFLPILAKYSDKNQMAIIAGLEHWNVRDTAYNFIVSIIPVIINGVKDAVVIYRLKNHYAHIEELIIRGFGVKVPKPFSYRYDLINWRNLYFTSFYCFELADTYHRSLFRSKIDLLIASEWNKDTPYFSNIVEALSRDLHCYIAQVNTSQYGDSRLTQPTKTARKDLMKLMGGKNDTILVEEMNIFSLRDFQLKHFERIKADNDESFKPMPPDWDRTLVNKRINNDNILEPIEDEE
jgi:hypothetical protein